MFSGTEGVCVYVILLLIFLIRLFLVYCICAIYIFQINAVRFVESGTFKWKPKADTVFVKIDCCNQINIRAVCEIPGSHIFE